MYESETVDLLRIAHLSVSGVKGRCERVSSWWTSVIAGRHEAPAGPRTRRLNGGEHVTTSWVVLLVDAMLFNVYTAYTIIAPARGRNDVVLRHGPALINIARCAGSCCLHGSRAEAWTRVYHVVHPSQSPRRRRLRTSAQRVKAAAASATLHNVLVPRNRTSANSAYGHKPKKLQLLYNPQWPHKYIYTSVFHHKR